MQSCALLAAGTLALISLAGTVGAQGPAPGFRLYGPMSGTTTWLVDTNGTTVHTWRSTRRPGLGVYLLDDGTLLRTINTGQLFGTSGGIGGGVQKLALDGTVLWDFRYDGPGVWHHHDVEELPNGNVLMIAWEDRSRNDAIAAGRNPSWTSTVFRPDHIIEVQPTGPTSGAIVWEWHIWDHLIQDFDIAQANFGVIADHPELVDINYPPGGSSTDWNHSNGIDYDPVHDWIVLSVRNMNEFWIIDHSTTTVEAAGHTGGTYGMGGDLLYRWGNPQTYDRGTQSDQQLFGQHSANIIQEGYPGAGNVLLFNNNRPGGSAAWEIVLPLDPSERFILPTGQAYGPSGPVWSFTGGIQSSIVSSARRAPNGNTLICAGSQGRIIEVTAAGQQVWSRSAGTSVFHAHFIEHNFWEDRSALSANKGGTVRFDLIAGSEHSGDAYLVLGSATGTFPGTTIHGQLLPLNVDSYFFTMFSSPGVFPFGQTLGTLNSVGKANASFTLPPGLPFLAGLHLDHAFVAIDPTTLRVTLASNAVPLDLIQ